MKSDTIAAIATGMGNSGIGIIRISGNEAIEIADKLFKSKKSGKKLKDQKSHTVHYGNIVYNDTVLDEVLVVVMKGPNSYTREDVVEINSHGGSLVMKEILEAVIKSGARVAEPGEFTKRAFLNGRIDLSQAEAVIDIINSKNKFALKCSVNQLSGKYSEEIKTIRDSLIYNVAYIESALDDPEHISLDGFSEKLNLDLINIHKRIEKLLETADNGKILKEGINTVILGKPNAGKSSLMNILVGEDRAIVTDVEGTTRDILEVQINLNGITLNLIDTAGIRDTKDIVEKIGVDKAKKYAKEADLIIYVVDASREIDDNDEAIFDIIKDKNTIVLLNKNDLDTVVGKSDIEKYIENCPVIQISAKEETGIEEFTDTIKKMFLHGEIDFNDEVFITNVRHKTSLNDAKESIELVIKSIENNMPEDFLSIDLMSAYEELGKITGESVEDDLVNEIFSKFCMGK